MSKYDKTVSIEREEEGTYHRREYEASPPARSSARHYTYEPVVSTYSSSQPAARGHSRAPAKSGASSDEDNFDEWTTSKRKVNHKTRQVETRVTRQLLVEDGKVIADSGPQVTTRIKEDNKVDECEKEKQPKNRGRFEALEGATECADPSGRVLGEKKKVQRVKREVREENMQYHDERFKELTGHDVHRRAIQAPHELITITDQDSRGPPRGKMVHYQAKGKTYQDTDEVLEVAKLAIDGSITKETKRTKHHEEFSEDERPDEHGEADELRHAPKVERSSRKHADYVNDFDDTDTPSEASDDEIEHQSSHPTHSSSLPRSRHQQRPSSSGRRHKSQHDEEAFPRIKLDPLLNSLDDDDYRPATSADRSRDHSSGGRYREHSLERKEHRDSSDIEHQHQRSRASHHVSSYRDRSPSPVEVVEIPEAYRVSKSRGSKSGSVLSGSKSHQNRERSFSPDDRSGISSRGQSRTKPVTHTKSRSSPRGDASIQANLTDEEEERRSLRSSGSSGVVKSQERTTQKLQRQSTGGSKRNYYFGDRKVQQATQTQTHRRTPSVKSISSLSSSDLSDPKDRMRKQVVRSRDSGFKSPTSHKIDRNDSPTQVYSVSDKRSKSGATSPTPTTGSAGRRSVKTTTTTMSAGLADRPLSRNERSASRTGGRETETKVSKPPSPFQKLAKMFSPSSGQTKTKAK